MAGTKSGGIKARDKNKAQNPNHYYEMGCLGGMWSHPMKGFGSNRELASIAGRVGGMTSRRGIPRNKLNLEFEKALKHLTKIQEKARKKREARHRELYGKWEG